MTSAEGWGDREYSLFVFAGYFLLTVLIVELPLQFLHGAHEGLIAVLTIQHLG